MRALVVILISLFSAVFAEENSSPFDIGQGVPVVVGGCVNVVSGDYLDQNLDISLFSPAPLTFERTYTSGDTHVRSLFCGWRHNHDTTIKLLESEDPHKAALYTDKEGRTALYKGKERKGLSKLKCQVNRRNVNCGSGWMCARNNAQNTYLLKESGPDITVHKSTGVKQEFKRYEWDLLENERGYECDLLQQLGIIETPVNCYRVVTETFQNGSQLHYSYDKKDRIREIKATNGELDFGSLSFSFDRKNGRYTITSSNGQSVKYDLNREDEGKFSIRSVTPSEGPSMIYTYDEKRRIVKKSLPGRRYHLVNYYHRATPYIDPEGNPFVIKEKEDRRRGRVYQIKAPLGEDTTAYPLYTFFYKWRSTDVVDALGALSTYEYDKYKRLTKVSRGGFTENYNWDEKGRLISQSVDSLYERNYTYDDHGNILSDVMKGANETPVERRFAYSEDHLLVKEEDGISRIEYEYVPGSDLIAAKFVYNGDAIAIRTFYEYDNLGTLSKTMRDDGRGRDKNDLSHVTERLIQVFRNRKAAPFGLPEVIEDRYLDLQSGKEKLLKKRVLHYTNAGKVKKEEYFDAANAYLFALTWEYDKKGNIVKETDALGNETTRSYDWNGNLITEEGAITKKFSYDCMNRLKKEEVEGHATYYSYDKMGNLIETIDTCGRSTQYQYNPFSQLVKVIHPGGFEEAFERNPLGHVTTHTNQSGEKTQSEVTLTGKPCHVCYADGTEERFSYDKHGNLIEHIAKNGLVTTYAYDYQDRLIKEVRGGILQRKCHYNAFHLLSETDSEGIVTTYTYDPAGRLASKKRDDHLTTYSYDSLGREHIVNDGRIAVKSYDLQSRLIEEQIGDKTTRYTYDRRGNITSTEIGTSRTETTYDFLNRPLTKTDAEGKVTYFEYRHENQILRTIIIDPAGFQTVIDKNEEDKVLCEVKKDPFGEELSKQEYTYTPTGELASIGDAVEYHYSLGKLVKMIEAPGTPVQRTTTYTYNAFGERESVTKQSGVVISYTYDLFGRLKTLNADGISYAYIYNSKGLPIQIADQNGMTTRVYRDTLLLEETLATGHTISYQYDAFDRLTQVTLPDGSVIDYTHDAYHLREIRRGDYTYKHLEYDETGLLLKAELPDGSQLSYSYDESRRLRALTHPHQTQTLDNFDERDNPTGINGKSYQYDGLNHLISDSEHAYSYDSLHNRTQKDTTEFSYNVLNQNSDYQYDSNGNLLLEGFKYDALDRLIEANGITYTYDPFNRRLTKDNAHFLYLQNCEVGLIEDGVIQELRILRSLASELGNTVAIEKGELYVPLHDLQGNIVALLNKELIESYSITPFGEESVENPISPWRFASKRVDAETGLVNFGYRFYDPVQGRFINPDPAGYGDGPNLYAYVHGNPMANLDLFGLSTLKRYSNYFFSAFFSTVGIRFSLNTDGEYHFAPMNGPVSMFGPPRELSTAKVSRQEHSMPQDPTPHKLVVYVNGVLNDEEAFDRSQTYLSELTDHEVEVIGVFHKTESDVGILDDFLRYFQFRLTEGLSNASKELINVWSEFCVENPDSGDKILQFCHSEGAQHVKNALKSCPEEIRERVDVVVIAGAAYIDSGLCSSVVHYVSKRDIVPFADPLGFFRALSQGTVEVLRSHPKAPWFDHTFVSPTYQKPIEKKIQQYLRS